MTIQEQYAATEGFKELRAIVQKFLERHTLELAFAGEDVSGIPHAKQVVDAAFEELDDEFGPKEVPDKSKYSPR